MALFSGYSCLVDQTSSSPSRHSVDTPRKKGSGNPCKNLSATLRSDQKLSPLWADTQCWPTRRTRHLEAIPYLPQGKQPLEIPVKIWERSNGRIKSYGPFDSILKVGDQTSSSLNDSIAYPTKTASVNHYKNLSAIQRSDQKLWPFSAIIKVGDQTSSSLNNDFIAYPTKTASQNHCKNLSVIQSSDKMLWPFWADTQGCRRDILLTEQWFHSYPNEKSLWKPQ
jgi:hypothetical protein